MDESLLKDVALLFPSGCLLSVLVLRLDFGFTLVSFFRLCVVRGCWLGRRRVEWDALRGLKILILCKLYCGRRRCRVLHGHMEWAVCQRFNRLIRYTFCVGYLCKWAVLANFIPFPRAGLASTAVSMPLLTLSTSAAAGTCFALLTLVVVVFGRGEVSPVVSTFALVD
jgi:hypothetical protein